MGLLLVLFATQAFIDLELAADLGPWHANAPLADLVALALLGLALPDLARGPRDPPAWRAALAFLAAAALSSATSHLPLESAHTLLRKPLFLYLAYGVGVASWARRAALRPWVLGGVLAGAALTALVSLGTSALRVLAGHTLWFEELSGLTPNHKTLAVALAGALPLSLVQLWGPRRRLAAGAVALTLLAIALSLSKTAWLTTLLALGLFWPAARPVATRWRLSVPAFVAAVGLAVYAPVLLGSRTMLDAARSRHSLNVRAWEMVSHRPLLGTGPGTNIHIEQVTFPHYRVNGVDAHGVVQKVASETGLLGLGAFGLWVAGAGGALTRRWRSSGGDTRSVEWASLATFVTLHGNLLLSTETFSQTHWAPLAVAWGLSAAGTGEEAP